MRIIGLCLALAGCGGPLPLRVVTANVGTTPGLAHDQDASDGYTSAEAAISDTLYGDGLAWNPAVERARAWLADARPDIVAFQELFDARECVAIEVDPEVDFFCRDWQEGDPLVVEQILGPDYQIACAPGQSDNCVGVRRAAGSIEGCDGSVCMEGLDGLETPGECGRGARVSRARVELVDGAMLTTVVVHGTSGISGSDQACRAAQVDQVFVDRGDGEPLVEGDTLVLGDLNTDPGRLTDVDESAARWVAYVGGDSDFQWHTDLDAEPSYAGVMSIDHVASNAFTGGCVIPGVTPGEPTVWDVVYWDHEPVVCDLEW